MQRCASSHSCLRHAGQEKFRSINSLYYRGAAAAVVVFDVTSRASFASVPTWLEELRKLGAPRMITALAANKSDLKTGRVVSTEEGKEAAARWGMLYGETSARTGAGIADLFKAVGESRMRLAALSCTRGQAVFSFPACMWLPT